jgi:hypothetical protein
MATKRRELMAITTEDFGVLTEDGAALPSGSSCFGKADIDEPLFVLRAQDRCAPAAVRDWAHRATNAGCSIEKVAEAMDIALEMEEWQARTGRAKWPD